MHNSTIKYYEENAEQLAQRYANADVSDLRNLLAKWLPDQGRVLEIGCGTGRESFWMADRGLSVTATDASRAMLLKACSMSKHASVSFTQAVFPLDEKSELLKERFDAIVCVAVLMHIPDNELFDVIFQMREMLKPGGRVVCSFCNNRAPDAADARLFVNRAPQEIQLLFERIGFSFRFRKDNPDGLGRSIIWSTLVFDYDSNLGGRPVDQIETIINRDKKTATYKLALLRALCDLAQSGYRNIRWHQDGTVSVPLTLISEKWLYYYWPLFETPEGIPIPQIRGPGNLLFGDALGELIQRFSTQNQMSGFHCAMESACLNATDSRLLKNTLDKIEKAIVNGPVRYATQGDFRFDKSLGRLHFNAGLWREMCLLGHWISDAILFRWAELCVDLSKKRFDTANVLRQLLVRPETERDVVDVRNLYQNQKGLTCVWTQAPLHGRRFDVDHVVPFVHWHNNDLWNLLPADSKVNNNKRDKLVSRDTLFASRDAMIEYWQLARSAMPERFDFEISRTLFGRNHPESQWEQPAFSALVEAVETIAVQRNVERWHPIGVIQTGSDEVGASVNAGIFSAQPSICVQNDDDSLGRGFKKALPFVGRVAAGSFFNGFLTNDLARTEDVDWVDVPAALHGAKRFVVRVDGDSMEPLFHIGDLLVFEYHRTPRQDGQIVIAADFTDGSEGGEYAVKRLKSDSDVWVFCSENPDYSPVKISKASMPYPILGIYVGKVGEA